MLPNCRSIRCEISCAASRFIVCAHEFSLAERNFEEKSPFVQANYRSIRREISCELSSELSSKNHGNKERNSRISLALLLHNTVTQSDFLDLYGKSEEKQCKLLRAVLEGTISFQETEPGNCQVKEPKYRPAS